MRKIVTMAALGAMLAAVSPGWAQQTDPVISQGASGTGTGTRPPPIVDKQAEYRAKVDKSIADYDAKMEEYRRQVRENEARNAEIRRRNQARAALYKACVAGDKAACARYNSGQ